MKIMGNHLKQRNESFARHSIWIMQKFWKCFSYLRLPDQSKSRNTVFFIIDPHYFQGGLADRIKALVNTYFIAKSNGLSFKLYFRHPFDIEKYYKPNKVNWRCELNDLDKSILSSRLSFYKAEYPIPVLKKGLQYHYYWYVGVNLLGDPSCNPTGVDREIWRKQFITCFDELFTPSEYLLNLATNTGLRKREYISVHFRFVNLLGNFEGHLNKYPTLKESEQKQLIKKCLESLKEISSRHPGKSLYVFSDSEKFLKICEGAGYHRISGGQIGHIAHDERADVADKVMLDFYIIGGSETVYSVAYPGMNLAEFAFYAAATGGAKHHYIKK